MLGTHPPHDRAVRRGIYASGVHVIITIHMRHGVDFPAEHSVIELFRATRIIRRNFKPDDARRSIAFLCRLALCVCAHISLFEPLFFVRSILQRTNSRPEDMLFKKFLDNPTARFDAAVGVSRRKLIYPGARASSPAAIPYARNLTWGTARPCRSLLRARTPALRGHDIQNASPARICVGWKSRIFFR